MEIFDSDDIRLFPGQGVKALCRSSNGNSQEVGFFLRPIEDSTGRTDTVDVQQRAGLVKFNDVLLVLTILKINNSDGDIFDVWWNFHAPNGPSWFSRMSKQEDIIVHLCDEHGARSTIKITNEFRKFFGYLLRVLDHASPWTEIEFDRAVIGFCAENYPKSSLWDMVQSDSSRTESDKRQSHSVNDYPGFIPLDLRDFYRYEPEMGHCVSIIPSNREDEAASLNIEDFLEPAPVKTVLRCGVRWIKGYPVAPIPFIPGHGLAIPPEDVEF